MSAMRFAKITAVENSRNNPCRSGKSLTPLDGRTGWFGCAGRILNQSDYVSSLALLRLWRAKYSGSHRNSLHPTSIDDASCAQPTRSTPRSSYRAVSWTAPSADTCPSCRSSPSASQWLLAAPALGPCRVPRAVPRPALPIASDRAAVALSSTILLAAGGCLTPSELGRCHDPDVRGLRGLHASRSGLPEQLCGLPPQRETAGRSARPTGFDPAISALTGR